MPAPLTRHYCTYFDQRYLVRGLTMRESLARHGSPMVLWVLCLDDASHATLERLDLEDVRPVRLAELEAADPELREVKGNRPGVEYFFTLSPAWPRYLLQREPGIEAITYLDSDLYFFSSPGPVFREMGAASALVISHRFPKEFRYLEVHGIYNVGFLSFRNDAAGRALLEEWRAQCLEWCHARVEPGRFADQKYLDAWPSRPGVHVLEHRGAGLAPWNWMQYRLALSGGELTVDGDPLVFFHFHGLKLLNRWFFQPNDPGYGRMPSGPRRHLYGQYLRALARTEKWVHRQVPDRALAQSASLRYAEHSLHDLVAWLRRGQLYTRLGVIPL